MRRSIPLRTERPPATGQVQLPDFGIRQWCLAPVDVVPALLLYREDLGVNYGFFEDYAVSSLDEALVKFMNDNPFDSPLQYTFNFVIASLFYDSYVSSPLLRRTTFEVGPKQVTEENEFWEAEKEETIFQLYIDEDYRRRLRVGGHHEEEAITHWQKTATFLRQRIRTLRATGAIT